MLGVDRVGDGARSGRRCPRRAVFGFLFLTLFAVGGSRVALDPLPHYFPRIVVIPQPSNTLNIFRRERDAADVECPAAARNRLLASESRETAVLWLFRQLPIANLLTVCPFCVNKKAPNG